jgi:hypothetical protein
MTASRVHRCLEPGSSVLVGTVDAQGVPSCCRAVALASSDDLRTATVFVPLATSQDTMQNVATTKRLAVAASFPLDHCTTQLKGSVTEARLATDEERTFIRGRLEAFTEVLDQIGVPRRLVRRVAYWPALAITMRVDDVFEQTPGPRAGQRIR